MSCWLAGTQATSFRTSKVDTHPGEKVCFSEEGEDLGALRSQGLGSPAHRSPLIMFHTKSGIFGWTLSGQA